MLALSYRKTLDECIQMIASKENHIRESIITFNTDIELTQKYIIEIIQKDYGCFSTNFKSDGKRLFVKFNDRESKFVFIQQVMFTTKQSHKLVYSMVRPNYAGHHFTRKPISLQIKYIQRFVIARDITSRLEKHRWQGAHFFGEKEGKMSSDKTRTLYFKTNGPGFDLIFDHLQGRVQILTTRRIIMPRLYINLKICNNCLDINPDQSHNCHWIKVCHTCGKSNDHLEKDCSIESKMCFKCKQNNSDYIGHKAGEADCPIIAKFILSYLMTLDIPMKYFEKNRLKEILFNSVSLNK